MNKSGKEPVIKTGRELGPYFVKPQYRADKKTPDKDEIAEIAEASVLIFKNRAIKQPPTAMENLLEAEKLAAEGKDNLVLIMRIDDAIRLADAKQKTLFDAAFLKRVDAAFHSGSRNNENRLKQNAELHL